MEAVDEQSSSNRNYEMDIYNQLTGDGSTGEIIKLKKKLLKMQFAIKDQISRLDVLDVRNSENKKQIHLIHGIMVEQSKILKMKTFKWPASKIIVLS